MFDLKNKKEELKNLIQEPELYVKNIHKIDLDIEKDIPVYLTLIDNVVNEFTKDNHLNIKFNATILLSLLLVGLAEKDLKETELFVSAYSDFLEDAFRSLIFRSSIIANQVVLENKKYEELRGNITEMYNESKDFHTVNVGVLILNNAESLELLNRIYVRELKLKTDLGKRITMLLNARRIFVK